MQKCPQVIAQSVAMCYLQKLLWSAYLPHLDCSYVIRSLLYLFVISEYPDGKILVQTGQ